MVTFSSVTPLGDVTVAAGLPEAAAQEVADVDADAALTSRTQRSNRFLRKRLWMRMTRETFTPEDDPFPAARICMNRGNNERVSILTRTVR